MFTGLIHHMGTIHEISPLSTGKRLVIDSQFTQIEEGESIALDGACLTALPMQQGRFAVELSTETLRLTIANNYQLGQLINLERALKIGDRLGGHFVSGHVDQVARVKSLQPMHEFSVLTLTDLAPAYFSYLSPKGSLCVNGVSLTINRLQENECEFMLIPHTLTRTNLGLLQENSLVNLEFDLLAKIIKQQIQGQNYAKSI